MKLKWPLWAALIAGLAGTAMLTMWFPKYWPASSWTVSPRSELLAKAQQISEHFGLASGWKPSAEPQISYPLAHYARTRPDDAAARAVSPLSLRITFSKGGQKAAAGVDSAGLPIYWRAPDASKSPPKSSPTGAAADATADAAFRFIAGPQAAGFGDREQSMGDSEHEEDYTWRMEAAPNSDIKQRIKVVTRSAVVHTAERKAYLGTGDDDSSTGDGAEYWDILDGLFGLLCSAAAIVILVIYVLWLARKAVNHQFPIRIAAVSLAIMAAALVFGNSGEKMRSFDSHGDFDPVIATVFVAGMMLCTTAVGRGISLAARPKWMSLEQICLLAPVAKSTGESLLAGVLFSPLLVAVPFLIAACGLFHRVWVLPHNAEILYSPAPLLDSVSVPSGAYLLGFFGFVVPGLGRMISARVLRWMVILPLGVAFFVVVPRVVSGPLAPPLVAGLLTLALFWFVYARFDLLAVLTLQLASALLLSAAMLAQKGGASWGVIAALAILPAAGLWFLMRGKAVAEGDPRATNPAISGFRAEREKLKAEFSLARRAQQDMLPQTPPSIPGYTIAASCEPSLEVGGDLYDFLKLPDGRFGIGVADVSGKGVPAALYMTLTKGLLASVARDNSDLAGVMEEVNRHLHTVTRKKVFVTMVLGFLDAEKRQLECARAGHNPIVWRQAATGVTTLVSPGGLGLGITAGRVFGTQMKVTRMQLGEGDAVVFYSDGVTEAMNRDLEQFGEQRLMDAVQNTDRLDAAAARDSILAEVKGFLGGVHPQDDITLVVLRVGALN